MHIIETYALSCGLKIDKPHVFENYTTVPFDKFISFNKSHYPFYPEVLALIKPELDKRGISILQLKAKPETVDTEVAVFDNLNFGQWAYVISRSMLHFGEDDFLFDLCGYYDIPRVILFSNTFPTTTKPYWGSPEKEEILSTLGPWGKPSLSPDPNHNFVRFIKPEDIAKKIFSLLGIEWKAPYETVYPGSFYRPRHDMIELVPLEGAKINVNGPVANIAIRMDYAFNEQFLVSGLQQTKLTIVTNQPINSNLLQTFRANVIELLYIVEEGGNPAFVSELSKFNFPFGVVSYLSADKIGKEKEKFFEVCTINVQAIPKLADIKALSDGLKGLSYKSSKRVFSNNQEFKSRYDSLNDRPSSPNEFSPCPDTEAEAFMKELEFFFIVKMLDN